MKVNDAVTGSGLIVLAVSVLIYTRDFPRQENGPGPALFPNILSLLLILVGIILIIMGIKSRARIIIFDREKLRPGWLVNIIFVLGAIIFYILVSAHLGFLITSFIILLVLMKWFKVRLLASLFMSMGITVAIYTLFAKILLVPLPWGLWGW